MQTLIWHLIKICFLRAKSSFFPQNSSVRATQKLEISTSILNKKKNKKTLLKNAIKKSPHLAGFNPFLVLLILRFLPVKLLVCREPWPYKSMGFFPLIRGERWNLTWISLGAKRCSAKVKCLRNMDIYRNFACVSYQEELLLNFSMSPIAAWNSDD